MLSRDVAIPLTAAAASVLLAASNVSDPFWILGPLVLLVSLEALGAWSFLVLRSSAIVGAFGRFSFFFFFFFSSLPLMGLNKPKRN